MGIVRRPKKGSRFAIINRLAAIREQRNVTRPDLGERVGYHHVQLGRYERGEATPTLQRLADWCEALGLELDVRPKQPKPPEK